MENRDQTNKGFNQSKTGQTSGQTKDIPNRQTGDRTKEMSPKKPSEIELPLRDRETNVHPQQPSRERHNDTNRPDRSDRSGQNEPRTR